MMSGRVSEHFKHSRSGHVGSSVKHDTAAVDAVASRQQAAAEAAGSNPLAQQEEQAEATLRQFDLATKYGPCTGITRMERWERAVKLGLEPPAEVRELVLRYGLDSQHNKNVFYHPF